MAFWELRFEIEVIPIERFAVVALGGETERRRCHAKLVFERFRAPGARRGAVRLELDEHLQRHVGRERRRLLLRTLQLGDRI